MEIKGKNIILEIIPTHSKSELGYIVQLQALKLNDYKVKLFSFCEYEGDVKACIRIKALCDNDPNIEIIPYEDFGFLDVFPNAKRVYGSRFHSIILSMYYGVPCVPFVYNEKTDNALMSYCEGFHSIDILKLSEYSLIAQWKSPPEN